MQQSVEEKVREYCIRHHMLERGDGVVLGVSGGADSVCLLFVLLALRKFWQLRLHVVHVNHGMREEAGEDASYVEKLCREHEIPFYLYEKDIPLLAKELGCSKEEAGRRVRYKNNYTKEAKFYEQNIGIEAVEKKIDKDKLEIAVKSNWVSIKQAAAILGISYTTLLAMRKEDKADGIMRIPYRGEGKNTRYYVPILEAYKSKDMDLVTKLEKEIG